MSRAREQVYKMTRTLRFRLVAALLVFLLLAVIGVTLAVSARSERDALLADFSGTWTSAQAAARLEHCVSDLHRQSTLLAQGYAGGAGEGVSPEIRGNFAAGIAACERELSPLRSVTEQETLREAGTVLGHLRSIVDKLGVEHVEAIRLLAVEVDPRTEVLALESFPQLRARLSTELARLEGEIGALGRRGDQTLIVSLLGPLLAFALIAGLLLRRVLRSLSSVAEGMRAFGSGDLTHRVNVDGADEFSEVASHINIMAGRLAANQRELENYALELERSLATLKEAQRAAVERQKLAALGELVAGVAHEVNTPLGVAVTSASLAHDHLIELQVASDSGTCTRGLLRKITGELKEVFRPLEENLARAARLISSFKQVAVDRATVMKRTVRLDQWTLAVGQSLAPTVRHHRVEVEFDVPPITVCLAAGELEQILTNLILNACIHAFPEPSETGDDGPRRVHVVAGVDEARAHLRLTVSDNGAGMPHEVAARVFEPFFTTRRGRGGSGLGMHIVHQLVHERFEGRIEVVTSPGTGTTWSLTLPMPTDALSHEQHLDLESCPPVKAPPTSPATHHSR